MGQHLLSVRILFHVSFAFMYLPMIGLGFSSGLNLRDPDLSFVYNRFDGFLALSALVGLGIFVALDILTILRNVNQRAFLAVDILVVVLMPLSVWPIILSCISVIWVKEFYQTPCGNWFCNLYYSVAVLPRTADSVTSACVIAATVVTLGLNIAFISYICIAAITDKLQGNKFLPIYPGQSLSSSGPQERWRLFGTQRTPTERAAVVRHCADYIFRHSVFRKHAFEPTAWVIFRGIIAVYSCVGLVAFSAYSGYIEFQVYSDRGYTVNDVILGPTQCADAARNINITSVIAATMTSMGAVNFLPQTLRLSPETYYVAGGPGSWSGYSDYRYPPAGFEISWTGNDSLLTWVTKANFIIGDIAHIASLQVNLTSPLILAPFKQYTISLSMMRYKVDELSFISYHPDVITSMDSASGSNTSATFSFNNFCQAVIQRQLTLPSSFSATAHVFSTVGGIIASVDGIFALIFGRTIVAIIVGTRFVSPFGLLGLVTRNRFKRLIHEQYPHMQEDIDRGGMVAYISEVAIDAALIDTPTVKGHASSTESTLTGDEMENGNSVGLYPQV
ncbi:hypothetical protein FIBSPDRAFT_1048594 [Athelia psychrophila]|uniref:Uncharacterized protein n=1 Tax=Athelia psychrophila TaxID=1759441 RepID=A0A166DKQ1_9AGAM|nr:hypothetical protein FIBSPDRAFT_1048594 [Fibularhizoctonia sp. CBS 109695]